MVINVSSYSSTVNSMIFCSEKCSGHGILEFSTDKAGQDVTPMNLQFGESTQQRSSTINSITGLYMLIDTVLLNIP